MRPATGLEISMFLSMRAISSPKRFFLSNLLPLVYSNINSINFHEVYLVNSVTSSGLKSSNCLESLPKYTFFIRTNKF